MYLVVAETLAPARECALFALAFHGEANLPRGSCARDVAAIVAANLASFAVAEVIGRAATG